MKSKSMSKKLKERNIYLDYLRGIAAICVLLFHYTTRYDQLFTHKEQYFFYLPLGGHAITAFFLISGYFAINQIECEQFKRYIVKRFFRLYPVYWAAILITFPITLYLLPSRAVSFRDAVINFTMLQSFLGASDVDGAYWTLGYEIVFYGLIAVACLMKLQKHTDKLCVAWVLFQMLCQIIPELLSISYIGKINRLFFLGNAYGQVFMSGVIVCRIEKRIKDKAISRLTILLSICLAYCIYRHFNYHGILYGIDFLLLIIVMIGLIILHSYGIKLPKCVKKIMSLFSFVAGISYPLYLIHQNIGYVIIQFMEMKGLTNEVFLLIPIILVVTIAFLLHQFIELPSKKVCSNILKRKIVKL